MSTLVEAKPRIRPMRLTDLERVMRIERAGHAFPWTEGIFRDCLRVGYVCLVLEQDGQIVAYGVMSVAAGEAHVFNVCVDPSWQRHGLGQLLMGTMLEFARERKASTAYLEVRPSNQAAVKLYEKLGFRRVGLRKDYYPADQGRENALIFACDL